jgi:hypothetical protein
MSTTEQISRDLQLNRQVAAAYVVNCRIYVLLVCRGEPKSLVEFTGAHGQHMAAKALDEKLDALIAKATDS